MPQRIVLTIAGSDPSGGAGIQADLRNLHALTVIGISVITALTAQNRQGVHAVYPVDGKAVARQLQVLLDDVRPDAVKIGMLGSADQVRAVTDAIRKYDLQNVVLDPVLASTGGVPLLDEAGIAALLNELMPLCSIITPNIGEAARLTGLEVRNIDEMERAARRLTEIGAAAAVVTGGHLDSGPTEVSYRRGSSHAAYHHGEHVKTPDTHGTGCMFSSALAAYLARDRNIELAISSAKSCVRSGLRYSLHTGTGLGYPYRPSPKIPHGHLGKMSQIHNIYVVTDPDLRPDRSHVQIARAALEGGASAIQLRDKHASTRELLEVGRRLRTLCSDYNTNFIVNDRVDVALACDADGVHLGPEDMHPADARALLGPDRIIGVSVSSVEEAEPLIPYITYLGVGAIFGSSTKTDAGAPIGVERIREIKAAYPGIKLVAIGGINHTNIVDVFKAGANTAAIVSAVICADDMEAATEALWRLWPSIG